MPSIVAKACTWKPNLGTGLIGNGLSAGLSAVWALNEGASLPLETISRVRASANTLPWVPSPYGCALNGNGTSTVVTAVVPAVSYTGPISVVALAAPAASFGRQIFIAANGFVFQINVSNNAMDLFVGSVPGTFSSNINAADGGWHTFGVTHNDTGAGGARFYRDGVPWGTATISSFPAVTTWTAALGSNAAGTANWLKGGLALVLVWTRPLSTDEQLAIAVNPWRIFRATGYLRPDAAPITYKPWIFGDQIEVSGVG